MQQVSRVGLQKIKEFDSLFLAIDESTDVYHLAQLVTFKHGIDKSFNITKELLTLQTMKGYNIYEEMKYYQN